MSINPHADAPQEPASSAQSDHTYLTTAETLTYLRTTPRTLYRRLSKGEIPAVRMGHQWRFRKADLDQWIAGQSTSPVPQEVSTPRAPATTAQPPRVLVVDDDADVRDTLTSILAITDFDVDSAPDGATAVGRFRTEHYDLIITDLRMPGLDGMGVAREAKRLLPQAKVLIVTGFPSQSSAIDAVNIGVDGYLTKPFRPIDVLTASARALNLGGAAGLPARGIVK
jgi:excisionase family DNA binding protein